MAQLRKGTDFATGMQVTADNLDAHVDNAILLHGAINEQASGAVLSTDNMLLATSSTLKKVTVGSVLNSVVPRNGSLPMTGELILSSNTPSTYLSAASKQYVDSSVFDAIGANMTGAIMAFYRSSPPAGWLECNGQSTAGYPALAALIGGNVPDLRGEFIRGWAHDRTGIPDANRALGSWEDGAIVSHNHSASPHAHNVYDPGHAHGFSGGAHSHSVSDPGHAHSFVAMQYPGSQVEQDQSGGPSSYSNYTTAANTASSTTGVSVNAATVSGTVQASNTGIGIYDATVSIGNTGGSETRPRNVAFMYCIKA